MRCVALSDIAAKFPNLVVKDPKMAALLVQATNLAKSDLDVLLVGESGVGKEIIAQEIFRWSGRPGPLVAINLTAIPETMMESELFGHEKGAFTGANQRRIGYFEQANQGVLFLDEIGDLPLPLQPKLLRVLQDKSFYRLGGSSLLHTDVRVLAATDKDPVELIRSNKFEKTLFFRFQATLRIPPLRERQQDIEALIYHFLGVYSRKYGKSVTAFSADMMVYLKCHPLPGNVRQLLNGLEWAVVQADPKQRVLTRCDLEPLMIDWENWSVPESNGCHNNIDQLTLKQITKLVTERRLKLFQGNKSKVAQSLGISRETLRITIKKYGIQVRQSDQSR